jgi:hypothetical protein
MAAHWYFCIVCKTPGCGEIEPLRYVGADFRGVPFALPIPFSSQCVACGQRHDYELHADVRPQDLRHPPAPDFVNKV